MIVAATTPEDKALLAQYIASKIGVTPATLVGQMPFEVISVVRDQKVLGAVLYSNYRVHTIEMACAGEKGWLTRSDLKGLFQYPFLQLGCWTVVSMVQRRAERVRAFNAKLGFKELGVIESGLSKGDDQVIFTMTRPQCRWLQEPESNVVQMPLKRPLSNGAIHHGKESTQIA